MGVHFQWGQQQNRKAKYLEIFKSIDHRPSTRELAKMIGVSANQVSRDIRELGLTDTWKSINCHTAAMNREELYKKYYFDAEVKMTTRELAELVGVSHTSVARDLHELEEKYGYGTLDRHIRSEQALEERAKKYEKYVNNSYCNIPIWLLAKELNMSDAQIRLDFHKLRISFITFNEFEHMNFVETVVSHIPFYKEYYFYTLFPKKYKDMADMLGIPEAKVRNELRFLRDNSVEYDIDLSYNRIEKRKEQYIALFNQLGYIPFCSNTAKFLSFKKGLVEADYRRFGFKSNEVKVVPNEIKYGAVLRRLPLYVAYQNSNERLSRAELCEKLGISIQSVLRDLKVLRKVFDTNIEIGRKNSKYDERLSLYSKYFEKHTFKDIKKLSDDLNLCYPTVINDFKTHDLYTFFKVEKVQLINSESYSEEEDNIIREYYPTEGSLVVNRLVNRTASGVRYRAYKLGVKHNKLS